jgi:mono/diheme cytochrome c family protein
MGRVDRWQTRPHSSTVYNHRRRVTPRLKSLQPLMHSRYKLLRHRRCVLICALLLLVPAATHADALRAGKAVYKKANCVGCHKWHGGGGGGYGGLAHSLRETQLDGEALAMVIRCGRPGTRMPYHERKAYTGKNRDCYEMTRAELEDAAPPRARYFLREPDIAVVVEYVQAYIQGRGQPDYDDCVAFWGAEATRCKLMAP